MHLEKSRCFCYVTILKKECETYVNDTGIPSIIRWYIPGIKK